jgi:hypothetical protein
MVWQPCQSIFLLPSRPVVVSVLSLVGSNQPWGMKLLMLLVSAVAVAEMSPSQLPDRWDGPVNAGTGAGIVSLALLGLLSLASPSEYPFPSPPAHAQGSHPHCV